MFIIIDIMRITFFGTWDPFDQSNHVTCTPIIDWHKSNLTIIHLLVNYCWIIFPFVKLSNVNQYSHDKRSDLMIGSVVRPCSFSEFSVRNS